jgi:hypothetical protein
VAQKSGTRGCKYLFLMIRFDISLRLKMGKDKYEFLRKCFNLPRSLKISEYSSPDTNDPDGILWTILEHCEESFILRNSNDGKKPLTDCDWRRHGSLAYDSMTIQEKIVFNSNHGGYRLFARLFQHGCDFE